MRQSTIETVQESGGRVALDLSDLQSALNEARMQGVRQTGEEMARWHDQGVVKVSCIALRVRSM